MGYNICKTCGASDGRAGNLKTSPSIGAFEECANCFDTRESGMIVIHYNLSRKDEELEKTIAILTPKK